MTYKDRLLDRLDTLSYDYHDEGLALDEYLIMLENLRNELIVNVDDLDYDFVQVMLKTIDAIVAVQTYK